MQTIMIVDDCHLLAQLVEILLKKRLGASVVKAESGRRCLELAKTGKPDLILLDILMEPMDGWDTLMAIKNDPDASAIPVVVVTAKPITAAEVEEFGQHIEDCIIKPFAAADLCEAVEGALARQAALASEKEAAIRMGADPDLVAEECARTHQNRVKRDLLQRIESQQAEDWYGDDGQPPSIRKAAHLAGRS
jgi:two-component system, OmpR family, response regulator